MTGKNPCPLPHMLKIPVRYAVYSIYDRYFDLQVRWSARTGQIHATRLPALFPRLLAVLPTAAANDTTRGKRKIVPGTWGFASRENEVLRRQDEVVSRALLQAEEVGCTESVHVQTGEVQAVFGPVVEEVGAHMQYFEETGKGNGGRTARGEFL